MPEPFHTNDQAPSAAPASRSLTGELEQLIVAMDHLRGMCRTLGDGLLATAADRDRAQQQAAERLHQLVGAEVDRSRLHRENRDLRARIDWQADHIVQLEGENTDLRRQLERGPGGL